MGALTALWRHRGATNMTAESAVGMDAQPPRGAPRLSRLKKASPCFRG